MKNRCAAILLALSCVVAVAQNQSPYTNQSFSPVTATAAGFTSAAIPLGKTLLTGDSYALANVQVTGTGLSTVTFGITASIDGVLYVPVNIWNVLTPGTVAATATATAPGVYQFSPGAFKYIKFVAPSGTFTTVTFTMTASPNAQSAKGGPGGGGGGGGPVMPFTPQCQFNFAGGSGTSWPATVGPYVLTTNGQPGWISEGLYFNGQESSNSATGPGACVDAANTILIFYQPDNGRNEVMGTDFGFVFSTDSGQAITSDPGSPQNGPSVYNQLGQGTNVHVSGMVAACIVSGSPGFVWTYNGEQSGMPADSIGVWSAPSGFALAEYLQVGALPWSGIVSGFTAFSQALTQVQCIQAYQAQAQQLAAAGSVRAVNTTDASKPVIIADGDSINRGLGCNYGFGCNIPANAITQLGVLNPYVNVAISGDTCTNQVNEYGQKVQRVLTRFGVGSVYISNCGTNDLLQGLTAAAILGSVQTMAQAAHFQGAKYVHSTVIPNSLYAGQPAEAQRLLFNTGLENLVQTGVIDGVDERANNPIMGNPQNMASGTAYTNDGTHPTALGASELFSGQALALHRVLNPEKPYCAAYALNPDVFKGVASTTISFPLFALNPGESVLTTQLQVSTAFAGAGISSLSGTVGDSIAGGTVYGAALSYLATGIQNTYPAQGTTGGTVVLGFTSAGANLDVITAGQAQLQVCIYTK